MNQYFTSHFKAILLVSLVLSATTVLAQPDRQYAKKADGQIAPATVAVDNVTAWPNLTVLRDGTIIATIFNKPSHGSMAGDVECWASEDGGRTWQKRGTPALHEPDTNRMNVAAGLAKNGDLIVIASGWSNRYPPGQTGAPFRAAILKAWLCRSTDGGRTWSVDKQALPAKSPGGDKQPPVPFGDIIEGRDGSLRVAMYDASGAYVYRSGADGKTWSASVAIDEGNRRYEPAIFHLGKCQWLAAVRDDGLRLYESNDDAKTWRYRKLLTERAQHPGHFLRLQNHRLVLSYGNRTPKDKGVDVRYSDDEGKSWSQPIRVVDFEGDGGYPSSVQLSNGVLLTVYYARAIKGHDRYHMGAVIWDPKITFKQ